MHLTQKPFKSNLQSRDRVCGWVSYFLTPSILTSVIVLGCALISSSAFWTALPGGVTRGSGLGLGIAPVALNKLNVLSAAPVKRISTFRGTRELARLKAPPPYVKAPTATVHPSHEYPSNCCTAAVKVSPCPENCIGGTTGTAAGMEIPPPWDACTKVDV